MGEAEKDSGGEPIRRLVFRSAGRTEEFFDRLQAHYRECKRKDTDAEADVRLVLDDGSEFDVGTARLKNVSPTGALLVDVKLSKGSYPAGPFTLELKLRSGPYRGIEEIFVAAEKRDPAGEQDVGGGPSD